MKKIIDILFYYEYLWYELTSYTSGNSEMYAIITLSGIISFYIQSIFGTIITVYFSAEIETWHILILFFLVFVILYFYLINRTDEIIKMKPSFFKNTTLTGIFVFIFSICSFIAMFVSAIYLRNNYPPVGK